MTIQFNVTGADRKKLVSAISQIMNAPMNYMGAPTFAYEIGEYSIDKTGTVTGPDNRDLIDILAEHHGFAAIIGEYDDDPTDDTPDIDQHNPGRYCDPAEPPTEAMLRQAESWMEGQPEYDKVVIEMPLDGFTPEAIENLRKLVFSKETLIKKALGADELPIEVLEDRIAFPWFKDNGNSDAYAHFIAALCKTAKEKKRVTAKAQESFENEKFAMRVWLIGLGLVGKEFSPTRKLLMANLDGNSGFRYGAPDSAAPAKTRIPAPIPNETAEQKAKRELMQLWANTDKRREFLKSHREWGVWITTPELGLTYYKYELPDGGRILAMEHQRENTYTHSGEEGLQTITTYFLWDGEHFTPHSASEYTIIDRLKNLKAALQKELCAAIGEESAPAPTDAAPVEVEAGQNSLAEMMADAALIHAVNESFENSEEVQGDE